MTELLIVFVVALIVIAGATIVGPRFGVASPLLLVAIGVAASFLPLFDSLEIRPEWVLEGLLPPLLYSSAVSMPSMNFRREFRVIGGLSVLLVVASSVLLGLLFTVVVPDLSLAWGVALGAIISPTDAVATSIVKRAPVSKRVVAVLDGESLLNDATALVLLRTAIVATAATFSFWNAVGHFALSVVIAVVVGVGVGALNLVVRKRVTDATVNTVLSFTVPFAASVPAELLGGSGLVAAVVAGLLTGVRAPRVLSPRNRLSDSQNWRTVELVIDGTIFLTMGLQIKSIVTHVEQDHAGAGLAVAIALGALGMTLLIRAAYVAPLLVLLAKRGRRIAGLAPRMAELHQKIKTAEGRQRALEKLSARRGGATERDVDRFAARIARGLADIRYFLSAPLGWREGTVVVWAGMRGAVTVAAAQTLPVDTPGRSVLILIAFSVATLSLVIQGGTIAPLLRLISPPVDQSVAAQQSAKERGRLLELIRATAAKVANPVISDDAPQQERIAAGRDHRLAVIRAQRSALLDARDNGIFDADVLQDALADLDAAQIAIELHSRHSG